MDNYFMKKLCQDAREGNNDMDAVDVFNYHPESHQINNSPLIFKDQAYAFCKLNKC